VTETTPTLPSSRADFRRLAATGAFSTLGLFLLCWVPAALGAGFTHGFIGLFTIQPVGSTDALWMGGLSAFAFGGIGGAIISHCYNLAGRMLAP
jgi:hypothetical protein